MQFQELPNWARISILETISLLAMIIGAIIVSSAYKRKPPDQQTTMAYLVGYINRLIPVSVGVVAASYIIFFFLTAFVHALR